MSDIAHDSNRLTRQWVERMGEGSFVCSGASVHPLLAVLLSAADGPAADELRAAVGDHTPPVEAALWMLESLDAESQSAFALALWVRSVVAVDEGWAAQLPDAMLQRLPDDVEQSRRLLDEWVVARTNGLLQRMPVAVDDGTSFVLASAMVLDFAWAVPFQESPKRWGDRWLPGLNRSFVDLDVASVIEAVGGPVGRFVSIGAGGIDVHLLTAAGTSPAEVIAAGIEAIAGTVAVRAGSTLAVGDRAGGLVVSEEASFDTTPRGWISLPAFEVASEHDLAESADVFGLRSAFDASRGHFPLMSASTPLAIGDARQEIRASFTAKGFKAAAVTAFAALAGAAMPSNRVTTVGINLDAPFGFLAVQRSSGLVLLAGWVEESGLEPDPSDLF